MAPRRRGGFKSRKAWQKLLRAVAAGWDGGADQRRARLDSEAYTARAGGGRAGAARSVTTYTAFMKALVEEFGKRRGLGKQEPLFVLAVDDADMNPSRSVELLDMLRMLWHPRVAFVLTGDSELFEQTLAEHFLGELRKPLRGHGLVESEVADLAQNRSHLRLAGDVYEKIIPCGHRCRLPPIPSSLRLSSKYSNVAASFAEFPFGAWLGPEPGFGFPRPSPSSAGRCQIACARCSIRRISANAEVSAPPPPSPAVASRMVEAIWQRAVRSLPRQYPRDTRRATCASATRRAPSTSRSRDGFAWNLGVRRSSPLRAHPKRAPRPR